MFDEQRHRLVENAALAHQLFYENERFGGPSLHFHLKALDAARNRNLNDFCEFSYAMLAAWGMHRMGPGGSKMCEFDQFCASISSIWNDAVSLQIVNIDGLTEETTKVLSKLFRSIKCMASATSLVGNSKILAHLLPNLVPPIDRQYTLNFLYGHGRISNDLVQEEAIFLQILEEFFYPLAVDPQLVELFGSWRGRSQYRWDTSTLKIVDNLIVGFKRKAES